VLRLGYVLGDSETGVCNTDDFLIRMLKGCIQLSARPTDHQLCPRYWQPALTHEPVSIASRVLWIRSSRVSYDAWKDELESYVSADSQEKEQEQHALMPLYHFCFNDLPATT